MVAVQHPNLKEADLFVAAECKHTDTQDTELDQHVLQRTFLGTDFLICCVACSHCTQIATCFLLRSTGRSAICYLCCLMVWSESDWVTQTVKDS